MKWGEVKMSKYKLIEEELEYMEIKDGPFLDKLIWNLSKKNLIEYKLHLAASVFLRLKVFCEDIEELSNTSYKIEDLINALYNDFLRFIKKEPDIDQVFTRLSLQLDLIGKSMIQPIENDENYDRLIYKDTELVSTYKTKLPAFIILKMNINRKMALRGEIFLADMEEKYPTHNFSIESILEILINDFINEVKNGKAKVLIESIIKRLD